MKLSYSGQEQVQAPASAVWAFVQDPRRVAGCLPEVQDVQVVGERHLQATVPFGRGLLRGKLKFDVEVQPLPESGRVNVTVRGGGLGNTLNMTAGADVTEAAGLTTLDWQGEADVNGPLVNMSGGMLDDVARKLIARTFRNLGQGVAALAAQGQAGSGVS